ncbi:Elongator complex protein 4 [Phytophthora ramorum]|uniref:Elongator complex protein 4 n=1 Tax=Phytophthora ramorum TaxID=164328 RepID=H3GR70_PHYRM|nr:Elongator complex protein 4 [Phytophthora ramorum]
MTSFRRKAPAASLQRSGTKPFVNGQTLVSSGLSELDTALGGGLLLGSLNLVETPPSDALGLGASASDALAVDLLRYFVAEGVADGYQKVAVAAPDSRDFVREQLPLELSRAQRQVKQQLTDEETPLTIAWQYAKYEPKQQRLRFCHSFDLSKSMHREMLEANEPVPVDLSTCSSESVGDVYEALYASIEQLAEQDRDGQVLRVAFMELGSPLLGAPDAAHMTALFGFLRRLRRLLSKSKSAVGLVLLGSQVLSAFPAAFINELRHVSDTVLTLSSFAGTRDLLPEELREFHGSLALSKLPRMHALACHAPSNTRFGLKRERRKLKIEKFHLPPEGSRSSNSSNCGSNTSTSGSSGTDPLAF